MRRGLILFAHGSREADWAAPFEAIARAARERAPDVLVHLAYLERMAPDLPTAIDALAGAERCSRIDIVPLFLGTGGHLRRDLPPLVQDAASRHPTCEITLHGAAGEAPAVIDALARHAVATTTR